MLESSLDQLILFSLKYWVSTFHSSALVALFRRSWEWSSEITERSVTHFQDHLYFSLWRQILRWWMVGWPDKSRFKLDSFITASSSPSSSSSNAFSQDALSIDTYNPPSSSSRNNLLLLTFTIHYHCHGCTQFLTLIYIRHSFPILPAVPNSVLKFISHFLSKNRSNFGGSCLQSLGLTSSAEKQRA